MSEHLFNVEKEEEFSPSTAEEREEEAMDTYETLDGDTFQDTLYDGSKVLFRRVYESAIKPKKATEGSAGYDFYAAVDCTIPYGHRLATRIPVGFQMELPLGWYGSLCSRSGLATVNAIEVAGGHTTVDPDFRGSLTVPLRNLDHQFRQKYKVKKHDKIAQMIIMKYESPQWVETDKLSETKRGMGGYGSTGR